MTSTKYIGMDVYKESISIAVMNSVGNVAMESVIETKASMILQFIDGLRGELALKKEHRPPGCTTYCGRMLGVWWCAIRVGTPC